MSSDTVRVHDEQRVIREWILERLNLSEFVPQGSAVRNHAAAIVGVVDSSGNVSDSRKQDPLLPRIDLCHGCRGSARVSKSKMESRHQILRRKVFILRTNLECFCRGF